MNVLLRSIIVNESIPVLLFCCFPGVPQVFTARMGSIGQAFWYVLTWWRRWTGGKGRVSLTTIGLLMQCSSAISQAILCARFLSHFFKPSFDFLKMAFYSTLTLHSSQVRKAIDCTLGTRKILTKWAPPWWAIVSHSSCPDAHRLADVTCHLPSPAS